jgi:hypothetical protein
VVAVPPVVAFPPRAEPADPPDAVFPPVVLEVFPPVALEVLPPVALEVFPPVEVLPPVALEVFPPVEAPPVDAPPVDAPPNEAFPPVPPLALDPPVSAWEPPVGVGALESFEEQPEMLLALSSRHPPSHRVCRIAYSDRVRLSRT